MSEIQTHEQRIKHSENLDTSFPVNEEYVKQPEIDDLRATIKKVESERDTHFYTLTKTRQEMSSVILERDAALAELAALRAQEPVAVTAGSSQAMHIRFLPAGINLQLGEKLYAAAGAAPVPEGWQLVPKEPTPKMVDATWNHEDRIESHNTRNIRIYKAMLAAVPRSYHEQYQNLAK